MWGAIHGVGLSVERFAFGHRHEHVTARGWRKAVRLVITFHVVCLSWVFFRADTISKAVGMLRSMDHFQWSSDYTAACLLLGILGAITLMIDLRLENEGSEYPFAERSPLLRFAAAAMAMALLVLFSAGGSHAFIYFQF